VGIEGKESTVEDGEDHWKEMDPLDLETGTVKPKEGKKKEKKDSGR